jgi:predicted DNA-binding transcriptional regulator YafY
MSSCLQEAISGSHSVVPRVGVNRSQFRSVIQRVIEQSDDLVLVLEYRSKNGERTRRVVSPIRLEGDSRFLALCLSRQEPRQFYIDQCQSIRVDLAMRYVMPVELEVLAAGVRSSGSLESAN